MDDPFAENLKISKFKRRIDEANTWEELEKICKEAFPPPKDTSQRPTIADPFQPYNYRLSDYFAKSRQIMKVYGTGKYDELEKADRDAAYDRACRNLLLELNSKKCIKFTEHRDLLKQEKQVVAELDVLEPEPTHMGVYYK